MLSAEDGMGESAVERREQAITRYLAGESPAAICSSLGYSRPWFYKWLTRYEQMDGAPAWSAAQSRRPHGSPRRTPAAVEAAIVAARRALDGRQVFAGAHAIAWELEDQGVGPPSVRTIGRVLARHALVTRRGGPYVPRGTRYPVVPAAYAGAVHQTDFVGPYALRAQGRFYSLHSVDVATARCAVEPVGRRAAQDTIDALWASWTRLGIPVYQQLDNESVFYGSHLQPRGLGPVLRLCLSAAVEPWFIPIGEPWRNGIVERFNGWWHQRGPLRGGRLDSVTALRTASWAFEARHNAAYRYSKLAGRTPNAALAASDRQLRFPPTPAAPRHPLARPEQGRYHVVRLIRSPGLFDLFGETFPVPPETHYEYVRATVDVAHERLTFYLGTQLIDERPYALR
jgi:hypothetical protein